MKPENNLKIALCNGFSRQYFFKYLYPLKLNWALLLIVGCFYYSELKAQNCSNPIIIYPTNNYSFQPYSLAGQDNYFQFTADTSDLILAIKNNSFNTNELFNRLEIFSGTCNNLQLIFEDTLTDISDSVLFIQLDQLIVGTSYYFRLSRNNFVANCNVEITLNKFAACPYTLDPCNLVRNPGFETGPIPSSADQLFKAIQWSKFLPTISFPCNYSSSSTPDLFDINAIIGANPTNNPYGSILPYNGCRIAGYGATESFIGTLNFSPKANVTYCFGFYCAIENKVYNNGTSNIVEVRLIGSNNCNNDVLIYTSPSIINPTYVFNNWYYLNSDFILNSVQATNNYDKIEFRFQPNILQNNGLFIDEVSIKACDYNVTAAPDIICNGNASQLNANGGNTYSWSPSGSLNNATIANPIATPTTSTVYTVTITSQINCTETATVAVTVCPFPNVQANVSGETDPCLNSSVTLSCTPDNPLYTYLWSNTNSTSSFSTTLAGTYTVTITNNCGCSASANIIVNNTTAFTEPIIIGPTSACETILAMDYTINNPVNGVIYNWTSGTIGSTAAGPIPNILTGISTTVTPGSSWYSTGFYLVASYTHGTCVLDDTIWVQPCCEGRDPSIVYINVWDINASTFAVTYGNPFTQASGTEVVLNGTFTVDNNFTFLNCPNISMGDGAVIIVNDGITLEIVNSYIQNGCGKMWEGIHLLPASRAIIYDNSKLEDAHFAFNLEQNSELVSYNSASGIQNILNKNYLGIYSKLNSTIKITETKFDCSDLAGNADILISPYAGEPLKLGTRSYAGILLNNNNVVNIGVNSYSKRNTFNNLPNGIELNNCNSMLQGCEFFNILFDATVPNSGVGIKNTGGSSGTVFTQTGFGFNATPSFTNCFKAIIALQCNTTISDNTMDAVEYGVRAALCINPFKVLVNRNYINCTRIGIDFYNNTGSTGVRAYDNTIYQSLFAGGIGIQVNEMGVPNTMDLTFNEIHMQKGRVGIQLSNTNSLINAYSPVLDRNNIYLYNATLNGVGINLSNCKRTMLISNKINYSFTTQKLNKTGIKTFLSTDWKYDCNYVNNVQYGFSFLGNCLSPDGFEGNAMDQCENGLRIEGGATSQIGDQNLRGNKWIGNSYIALQWAYAVPPVNQSSSPFETNSVLPYYLNPTQTNLSFTQISGGQFDCSIIQFAGGGVDTTSVDELENYVTEMDSSIGSDPDAMEWQNRRVAYEKVLEDTTVVDSSALLQNFYAIENITTVGEFSRIRQQLFETENSISVYVLQLQCADSIVSELLHQISLNDSLISAGIINDSIIIVLGSIIDSLKTAVQNIITINSSVRAIVNDLRLQQTQLTEQLNAGIATTENFEQNERTVNGIYLSTVAIGVYSFTKSQIATLEAIANQCPFVGGTAVFLARSLLGMTDSVYIYYDIVWCANVQGNFRLINQDAMNPKQLLVYPNPAKDELHVEYYSNNQLTENISLQILNELGVVAFSKKIQALSGVNSFTIRTGSIHSGIYHLKIIAEEDIWIKKITIIR